MDSKLSQAGFTISGKILRLPTPEGFAALEAHRNALGDELTDAFINIGIMGVGFAQYVTSTCPQGSQEWKDAYATVVGANKVIHQQMEAVKAKAS